MVDPNDFETPAKLFKTLMHPVRLAILEILRDDEECVCHMEAILGLRQAYISQQLSVLKEARLVQDRRDGWNIYYRVVRPEVFDVLEAAGRMLGGEPHPPVVRERDEACPCPKCSPAPEAPAKILKKRVS